MLSSAGSDEQEHLGWVCGRLDVGQSLGPWASTDKPRHGENHCDNEILFSKIEIERKYTFVNCNSFVLFRKTLEVKKENSFTDHQGASVVLSVFVLVEDVDDGGQQRVQEGKNTDGQIKLSWRGTIPFQEEGLLSILLTQGSLEMDLL